MANINREFEKYMSNLGEATNPAGDGVYQSPRIRRRFEDFRAGFEAARAIASRPAEVDDEGLPPLPKPYSAELFDGLTSGVNLLFTAEQYRQGQRDAREYQRKVDEKIIAKRDREIKALKTVSDMRVAQVLDLEAKLDEQRDAVAADRARREQTSETTELLNNPPYGQPDLYSRLHTSLMKESALAKEYRKLPEWFEAARGLLDWMERESSEAPSHTTNKEKNDE